MVYLAFHYVTTENPQNWTQELIYARRPVYIGDFLFRCDDLQHIHPSTSSKRDGNGPAEIAIKNHRSKRALEKYSSNFSFSAKYSDLRV